MRDITQWARQSASRLSGAFACGIVQNRLAEVRRADMHEGVVVSWLLLGSGTITLDGETHALTPGCTCLRRPDRPYTMELDSHMRHVRCFLKLPEAAYPLLCTLLPTLHTVPAVCPLPYQEDLMLRIVRFIGEIRRTEDDLTAFLWPEAVQLLRALTAVGLPYAKGDTLARAAALLSEPGHFRTPLHVIAEEAGVPYPTLRKQFPLRYGFSPGQYRLRQRVELAKQWLATGEAAAKVAERLGFADVYAFSKQFSAQTGETPGHYRRHHIV